MQTSEETVATTPEEATLDSIVKSVKGELSEPVESTAPTAPTDGNTPEETPASPSDGQPKSDKPAEKPVGDASNKSDASKAPDQKSETPTDPALADLLGVEEAETPADVETLQKRYEESSKEAHRLVTERDMMLNALKKANVTIVQTGEDENGEPIFGLAPTDEYAKKDASVDVDKLWNELDDSVKDKLDLDPKSALKDIAKKIEVELLKQRPPVNAKAEEQVLPRAALDTMWSEFVDAKDKTGNRKYPDAELPEVSTLIGKLAQSQAPGMETFRRLMRSDKDFHKLGLAMLYWGASRILLPQKLAAAHAKNAADVKTDKNKKLPAIPSTSAAAPVAAQTASETSPESATLDAIVRSLKG